MARVRTISRWLAVAMLAGVLLPTAAWAALPAPNNPYSAVSFPDTAHGYIAGQNVLYRTGDGGSTWTAFPVPGLTMGAVTPGASGKATALPKLVSNRFYTTNDWGLNWASETPVFSPDPELVYFVDMAYLNGDRRVFVGKRDRGNNLALIASSVGAAAFADDFEGPYHPAPSLDIDPPITYAELTAIDAAPSGNVAWAVGFDQTLSLPDRNKGPWAPLIYRTDNAGSSWSTQTVGVPLTTMGINCVTAVDDQTAFIGQESGTLLKTVNGGASWSTMAIGSDVTHVFGIDAYDANHVLVAGCNINGAGRIAWTADAQAATPHWTVNTYLAPSTLLGAQMITPAHWMLVGDRQTKIETVDAGATWTGGAPPPPPPVSQPVASSIVLDQSAITLGYGLSTTITGTLKSSGSGFSGVVTVNGVALPATGTNGRFSYTVHPSSKTVYTVSFAGIPNVRLASSAQVVVTPRAKVSTPVVPKGLKHTKSFKVYSDLRPWHRKGTTAMKFTFQHQEKVRGHLKWVTKKVASAKASNYKSWSRCSLTVKLKAGKWRVEARHSDPAHATTFSASRRSFTVK